MVDLRISITAVIGLVIVLVTIIGIYAAADNVVSDGTSEANDTSNFFSECMSHVLKDERGGGCDLFSGSGEGGGSGG